MFFLKMMLIKIRILYNNIQPTITSTNGRMWILIIRGGDGGTTKLTIKVNKQEQNIRKNCV